MRSSLLIRILFVASMLLIESISTPARLFKAGTRAFNEQRHDEAISYFLKLQQETPSYKMRHEADKLHGAALASLSRGEEALWYWERAVKSYPKQGGADHSAFRNDVSQYVLRAAQVYHHNAQASPTDAMMQFSAGLLNRAVGQQDLAVAHLQAALKLQPLHPRIQLALGKLYGSSSRQIEEARQLLISALLQEPRQPGCVEAYHVLGALSCQLEELSTCRSSYVATFEAAVDMGDDKFAALGISSAAMVSIQNHGEVLGLLEAQALGERGVTSGVLHAPLQIPKHLVKGLTAKPWWDDASKWQIVRSLERHAEEIRDEVMQLYAETDGFRERVFLDKDSASLVSQGDWGEVDIIRNGQLQGPNIALLPFTSNLILSMPEATSMVRGGSKVSVMAPGTQVKSHSGTSNTRLRIHLGLSIPGNCGIVVNEEPPRTWVEGKCLTLDDSFVHSVWQNGTSPRVLLIVDVWHPELDTEDKREASLLEDEPLLDLYRKHRAQGRTDGTK